MGIERPLMSKNVRNLCWCRPTGISPSNYSLHFVFLLLGASGKGAAKGNKSSSASLKPTGVSLIKKLGRRRMGFYCSDKI